MDQLKRLREAQSIYDLAPILGFTPATLAYTVFKIPNGTKYSTFLIPKKGGGQRTISSPCPQLKQLQKSLSTLLQDCQEQAEAERDVHKSVSHGFRRKRSIVTNAKVHRRRRFVFNLDISDFFGSINFGRVRGFFISNRDFKLNPKVATLLAQIACHNNSLPQGSPCSPVISNLLGHILDMKMVRLAKETSSTYTRYADDLTFSTNVRTFPSRLATPTNDHNWEASKELNVLISKCGFTINKSKVRLQYRDSQQTVTGLVTNSRVNTTSRYRRATRAMAHRLFTSGDFAIQAGNATAPEIVGRFRQLEGRFAHSDSVDRLLNFASSDGTTSLARTRLFSRLMFYRDFHALKQPVLLFEGKTDRIYIRCALESLATAHPKLVEQAAGAPLLWKASFFKASKASARFHGLGGGTAPLGDFIKKYAESRKGMNDDACSHPVIIVVDNDSGLKSISGPVKKYKIDLDHTLPFQRICENLYVVCLPLAGNSMEDLFEPGLLATKLGTKVFNKTNKAISADEYGKAYFAEHVVIPNKSTIVFSGFAPVLSRIESAIDNYSALKAAKQAVP